METLNLTSLITIFRLASAAQFRELGAALPWFDLYKAFSEVGVIVLAWKSR